MPAQHQRSAANPPASPRSHAKYTNKDGSKFITVPKTTPSPPVPAPSSEPVGDAARMTNVPTTTSIQPAPAADDAPTVNRKKQKRRQKAAAKLAEQQAANDYPSPAPEKTTVSSPTNSRPEVADRHLDDVSLDGHAAPVYTNGASSPQASRPKKNKKKKKKGGAHDDDDDNDHEYHGHHAVERISDVLSSASAAEQRGPGISKEKIWGTSNHEERERIKEFWLGLGEAERKSLVKVEKDAVLKKMKEQQKHTCSCTVCGRKRNAIEEELEGLYDAYYDELEQFANHGEGPPMLAPPPRDYPPPRPLRALPHAYAGYAARSRIVEHVDVDIEGDEEGVEEIYSEEEVDEDDFSGDEAPEDYEPDEYDDPQVDSNVADFLTFGNSLQVKGTQLLESLLNRYGNMDLGGILTVADDLLKNDGKRFIEMMEQLAERRMQREEDSHQEANRMYGGHTHGSYSHTHTQPPPDDDDDDYEDDDEVEEEEEYDDSQEEEEYEDEEEPMTEEQRMEEGRRMFQIFAARMFEQRVLSAYKEKVANERQQKLLEELAEEDRLKDEQNAKKAKNAQKKKDKAAQKKQALAEEKARKEAEKAAEETRRLEAERQRVAEQRQKAEDKRKAREAQKKAEEEAKLKKEADRQRKIHEQREKQAETERKAREAKEREKKMKEEQRLKENQARELKEREARERKDKQERDKREKEARAAKAQKDAQEAREAKEKAKEEKAAAHKNNPAASQPSQPPAQSAKRTAPISSVQLPPQPSHFSSPKLTLATPALPKAALPMRGRTGSQQAHDIQQNGLLAKLAAAETASASTQSQTSSPHPMTPSRASPAPNGQRKSSAGTPGPGYGYDSSTSPEHGPPFSNSLPPFGMVPPPGLAHQMPPPGFSSRSPQDPMLPPGFRQSPNMMAPPPGMNGPLGRGYPPTSLPPPGFHGHADAFGMGAFGPGPSMPQHGRQGSAGFEGTTVMTPAQPISRPAPIGRPHSDSQSRPTDDRADDTEHLGSSALVDDEDDAPEPLFGSFRNNNQPPGPRPAYGASPFLESAFPMPVGPGAWAPGSIGSSPFPAPGFGAAAAAWRQSPPTAPPGFNVGSPVSGMPPMRTSAQPRHMVVRSMICQACRDLSSMGKVDENGFVSIADVKTVVERLSGGLSLEKEEYLDLCDTEGNPQNGGGSFDLSRSKEIVRWIPDHHHNGGMGQHRAVGEIGSPMIGQASIRGT